MLLQHNPGRRIGNLQATRVASEPLPRFMRGFATRAEVEAILAALSVSSCLAWAALPQRRRDALVVLFCLRLRLHSEACMNHIFILSHLHTFTSSYFHIFILSHLHTFTSSYFHIFILSHLHTFTSSYFHIFILSYCVFN